MAVDSKAFQQPMHSTGLFTTAASAVDVTETLGYSPSLVMVFINTATGQTPDILYATIGDTAQSILVTGSTGATSVVAVATGLDITATGFIVRSERQTDNGTNTWIAFR